MRSVRRALVGALALLVLLGVGLLAAPAASAADTVRITPDILGCTDPPTPEVPGRGVVGFFESTPQVAPAVGNPFAARPTTTIYEQYGYAGLRWNTYDLGCGPDIARSPDATVGTAVANWIIALPKAAVAATGAVVDAAFSPDFLGVFDPLIDQVVQTLRHTVFEQWVFLVVAAVGLLLIWRARHASLASSAAAVGWALLVMVLVTMVFRWPLVAGHAADATVTSTLAAVTGGLDDGDQAGESGGGGGAPSTGANHGDAAIGAISGMHEALLYQAWLGGTFGNSDSAVARQYGPAVFASQALTWREAQVLRTDPGQGKKIIEAKQKSFEDAAARIKAQDPDAYDYLTGQRSDSRVGYALLAGIATLCAVPFLFVAGLLVLGALVIVRFGVMLFPLFATLGLFPAMRQLVTGVASTVAAALINAVIFGIGAAVTVRGMGILLAPSAALPPWLAIVLMLLLSLVMWVALRPFRRLTVMVSGSRNHFAAGAGGVGGATRSAARAGGRVLTTALGTFLGVSAASRRKGAEAAPSGAPDAVPQRVEAQGSYYPVPYPAPAVPAALAASAAPAGLAASAAVDARTGSVPGRAENGTPDSPPSRAPSSSPRAAPTPAASRAATPPAAGAEPEPATSGSRFEGRTGGVWERELTPADWDRRPARAEFYPDDPRLDAVDADDVFRPAREPQRDPGRAGATVRRGG